MENQNQNQISKRVSSALQEIIKTAYLQNFKEDSKFITRHTDYLESLHKAKYPDAHARRMAKKVFSNEEAYIQKLETIRDYYRGDLLTSYEKLYDIYYEIIQTSQLPPKQKSLPSKDDAEEFMSKLLGKLNIS